MGQGSGKLVHLRSKVWDGGNLKGTEVGPDRQYTVMDRIGGGNFGEVYEASDTRSNEPVAIKFLPRGERLNGAYVTREVLNHKHLAHPHIIRFREVFLSERHLCIVMDYAPGGNLAAYVHKRRSLSEDKARWFFQQLILAVDYCHKQNIVIRDIKLANILLDEAQETIKLCDFGFSKDGRRDSPPQTYLGTGSYLPPEILVRSFSGSPFDQVYDARWPGLPESMNTCTMQKVDIWTCGIALFVMLFGINPFYNPTDLGKSGKRRMYERMFNMKKVPRKPSRQKKPPLPVLSRDCRNFIARILQPDPKARITVKGIMEHPWFRKNLPPEFAGFNDALIKESDKYEVECEYGIQELVSLAKRAPDDLEEWDC
ncbi:hypothetical protein BSKO_05747 [Bryopsis sp. KO-2023]|nr:hypothetical protein BSKO_05747 [Bryopsis sp. KO-2023]